MTKQTVNIGTVADDNTGDPIRDAFDKVNDNFTELYDGKAATGTLIDAFGVAGTTNTDRDANTTNHGLLLKAVAPASPLTNVVAIENGETIYKLKPLFDTTHPANLGTAAEGSAATAARRDHVHAMPSAGDVGAAPVDSPTFTTLVTLPARTVLPAAAQIDIILPTADHTATGEVTSSFQSGYSSTTIGDLVYLDSAAKWQKADKGTSAATYSGWLGITLEIKAANNAVKVLLKGYIYESALPTLTVGSPVYMDDAGAMIVAQPAVADHAVRVVGFGVNADIMYFNPSPDYVIYKT